MLCFETLTLAPIDRTLVDRDLLDDDEIAWLDAYHARVRETISPLVDAETRALAGATADRAFAYRLSYPTGTTSGRARARISSGHLAGRRASRSRLTAYWLMRATSRPLRGSVMM